MGLWIILVWISEVVAGGGWEMRTACISPLGSGARMADTQ